MVACFKDPREPWKRRDGSWKIISNVHTDQISFRGFFSTLRNFYEKVFICSSLSRRDVNLDPLCHVATLDFYVATSVWTLSTTSRRWFQHRELDLLSLYHVATWSQHRDVGQ